MAKIERNLKDKCVVITGGATGIGFQIGDNYLRKGAKTIIILDLLAKEGTEAAKKLNTKYGADKAVFIKCNIISDNDLEQIFPKIIKEYKKIDVVVNNAGVLNDADWKKCIDLNVTYLMGWTLKFWEHMRKDRGGQGGTIINLASIYGFRIDPYLPVYQGSKFAVFGFTKSLGHPYNYSRTGVRVLGLCPGFTKTNMTTKEQSKCLDDDLLKADLAKFLDTEAVWQTVDCVGSAAVDLFEQCDSGTAWLIEGGKPISQV